VFERHKPPKVAIEHIRSTISDLNSLEVTNRDRDDNFVKVIV